jgi:hypothetical protein
VTVLTTSLFIEALPGAQPVLEDFKARHRPLDMKKILGETRQIEIENLRRAARILADQLEDPDIDKKIGVEGATDRVIVPPDA